ncbi:MAG TPA: hypothetical protein VK941_08190 [Gillisia sp.]|nr:hypothetical protein [Gillisia sp.]
MRSDLKCLEYGESIQKKQINRNGSSNFIILFFYFIFLGGAVSSPAQNIGEISDEEYEVINSVLSADSNNIIYIYNKVYFDKGWANYFEPGNFESITSKVGVPVIISDIELDEILTEEVLYSIHSSIYSSKPVKLSKDKLNKSIKLTDSFDAPRDLKRGVQRISKPIIIDEIAIIRKIGFLEAPIYILRKENEAWKITYTFYDWLILE